MVDDEDRWLTLTLLFLMRSDDGAPDDVVEDNMVAAASEL